MCTSISFRKVSHPFRPGAFYEVPIPCRKCYECLQQKKSEWVFRIASEIEEEVQSMSFVTFTYNNDNLPFVGNSAEREEYIKKVMRNSLDDRKWDYAVLNNQHVKNLIFDIQEWYKEAFVGVMYDRVKVGRGKKWKYRYVVRPEWKGDHLVRYYLSAEYGCLDHRPHLHCLMFFSQILHKSDIENMCEKVWHYGSCFVEDITSLGAVNYVAKHQLKMDRGSDYQKNVSPIFRRVSVAYGGLGRCIKENKDYYERYLHTDVNGNYDQRFIDWYDGSSTVYHVLMPRFLTTYFRIKTKGYENRHMDQFELQKLEHDLTENYWKKISTFYFENQNVFANFAQKEYEQFDDYVQRVAWSLDQKKFEEYNLNYYEKHYLGRLEHRRLHFDNFNL